MGTPRHLDLVCRDSSATGVRLRIMRGVVRVAEHDQLDAWHRRCLRGIQRKSWALRIDVVSAISQGTEQIAAASPLPWYG